MRSMANFWTHSFNMQSFCYDYDNENYYCFNGSTSVLKYNSDLSYNTTLTLPSSAGHNNDAWYYDGQIIFTNGKDLDSLYVWNVANNSVSLISISGIEQAINGSTKEVGGICDTGQKDGTAYIVTRDEYTDELIHQDSDKMCVYLFDLNTGEATLVEQYTWDCVYVQGCACLNGMLYVACNTQTTGHPSNYTGLTLKAIRTDTYELFDTLTYSGNVEPEGMDVVPADDTLELEMGIAKWGSVSLATRFTAPYELI